MINTGLDALDRLLGGGLNPGDSAILTCANPDIARAAAYTIATNAGIDYGHGAHKVALIEAGATPGYGILANIARVPVADLDDPARAVQVERARAAFDAADLSCFGNMIPDLDALRFRLAVDGAADLVIVTGYRGPEAEAIVNDAVGNVYGAVIFIIDGPPWRKDAPIHAGIYPDRRGPMYAVDLFTHPTREPGHTPSALIHLPAYGRIENTARGV